jgi:hypothetical protein
MSYSYHFLFEQVFLLGAIAKLGATVVTYPLLVVKVNLILYTCKSSYPVQSVKIDAFLTCASV